MIEKIIECASRNRAIVLVLFGFVVVWGLWASYNTQVDAIPDLSDNQVIVYTEWSGQSPQIIEDQVTYPLVANLQGLPKMKVVRAQSFFGLSMIYVIFKDNVDIYWARTRVLERLNYAQGLLPNDVTPRLGPDGTGVGHVYWYTVESNQHDLAELRAIQDWYIRYQLSAVEGVAEVASIGGFVKQYQIDVHPEKLLAHQISLQHVVAAVQKSNNEVGGRLLEQISIEYVIRGRGYVKSLQDLERVVVGTTTQGVPIFVKDVATVQLGSDIRRGMLDKDGQGEVVGGIIVMRYGANAKEVINRVKSKIVEIEPGLPEGVSIKTAYDRSGLIDNAIHTLKTTLLEEMVIVSFIVLLFLFHVRSALIIIISLPLAVLISLIFMKYLGITSNIMSLGGIAIAIGVLVDAAVVMVENGYRHLADAGPVDAKQRQQIIIQSAKQVGRPILLSLIIIILSFAPIFLLEGQEGRLFRPLVFTKTFAMTGASLIAITLIPVLMVLFLKGRFIPESKNPIAHLFDRVYRPMIHWSLRHKGIVIVASILLFIASLSLTTRMGKEFMPPLDEGSLLFMPVTLPNVTITEAKRILQTQDRIIKAHPEVEFVLGKVGRAETATDPAPVSMIETIILLKPQSKWRKGITKDNIIAELDANLQIPGVSNAWTQPIINRINMLATGVRTELGVKIFGKDLAMLQKLAIEAEAMLQQIPGATDLYAERVMGGKYLDIDVDRDAAARLGLHVGDVQQMIQTAIGGMNLSMTVEGRRRFPIRVRYAQDFRRNPEDLKRVLVANMWNWRNPPPATQIPLGQIASLKTVAGPPMISSENALLRAIVFLNVRGRDTGGFVEEAKAALEKNLQLPSGYFMSWSGQYEHQQRAKKRLQLLVPAALMIIFFLLYLTFHSFSEGLLVIIAVPFGLIGGVLLQWLLGYNFSVAVWVGYIALAGVVVETGVVMIVYLNEAWEKRVANGQTTIQDLEDAVVEGSTLRLRPKLMTAGTSLIGLIPIMWSSGTGSDVMKPIATPMIGGMISSTLLVLVVLPVLYMLLKQRESNGKPSNGIITEVE